MTQHDSQWKEKITEDVVKDCLLTVCRDQSDAESLLLIELVIGLAEEDLLSESFLVSLSAVMGGWLDNHSQRAFRLVQIVTHKGYLQAISRWETHLRVSYHLMRHHRQNIVLVVKYLVLLQKASTEIGFNLHVRMQDLWEMCVGVMLEGGWIEVEVEDRSSFYRVVGEIAASRVEEDVKMDEPGVYGSLLKMMF